MVFDVVGWSRDRFAPAAPQWTGLTQADTRAAWTGTIPQLGGIPLRLEAGAFAGRVTYVQAIGPWTKPSREAPPAPTLTPRLLSMVQPLLIASLIVGSALLARRNLRAGRGDRAGASRVALWVGTLMTLRWLVSAHHFRDLRRLPGRIHRRIRRCAAQRRARVAGLPRHRAVAATPLAGEPAVVEPAPRRLVPRPAPRPRRPARRRLRRCRRALSGRDAVAIILQVTGTSAGPILNGVPQLTSARYVVAAMIVAPTNALTNGVLIALLYVMLRRILRRPVLAATAVMLIFALLVGAGESFTANPWLNPGADHRLCRPHPAAAGPFRAGAVHGRLRHPPVDGHHRADHRPRDVVHAADLGGGRRRRGLGADGVRPVARRRPALRPTAEGLAHGVPRRSDVELQGQHPDGQGAPGWRSIFRPASSVPSILLVVSRHLPRLSDTCWCVRDRRCGASRRPTPCSSPTSSTPPSHARPA